MAGANDDGLVVTMTQRVQQPIQRADRDATLAHTAALARQQVLRSAASRKR